MAYVMGIDVGTTGTRAVIVRPDGHVVAGATGDHHPMQMPKPGWAEQDPANWWEATVHAVRRALESAGLKGSEIAAVGRYDYAIVNEDLETAVEALMSIIRGERLRVAHIVDEDLVRIIRAFEPAS